MLIVPALILAIFCGTLAASISLIAGFGLLDALVAYWAAGNIALMVFLVPRLLFSRCDDCPQDAVELEGRPVARVLLATGWVTLGLAMVFWQSFHHDGILPGPEHGHDIGTVLGLNEGGPGSPRYLSSWDGPSGLRGLAERLLRIDVWVVGVAFYVLGTMRLLKLAAQMGPPPREG